MGVLRCIVPQGVVREVQGKCPAWTMLVNIPNASKCGYLEQIEPIWCYLDVNGMDYAWVVTLATRSNEDANGYLGSGWWYTITPKWAICI